MESRPRRDGRGLARYGGRTMTALVLTVVAIIAAGWIAWVLRDWPKP
jgi:hypothetical protein